MMSRIRSISLIGIVLAGLLWQVGEVSPNDANNQTLQRIGREADDAITGGDFRKAVALIEKGLKIDPNWKDGLWKAGLVLYQDDQFGRARQYLSRLTQVDGTRGVGWALLGMCEFQLREFRAAIEDITRADRLGIPTQSGLRDAAYLDRAIAYIHLGEFGTAIELLNKLVSRDSLEERERLIAIFGYASLHRSMEAPLSPEQMALVRGVGEAMYRSASGDRRGARALFDGLLRKHPKAPLLHYSYGSLLLSWLDYDGAGAEFRAELAVDPESYPARLVLAYIAMHQGEAPEGLRWATEAAQMRPDLYQSHFYLGQLLLRHDQAKEACAELEAARGLSPLNSGVRYALAKAYRILGRNADAERELQEFARLKALEEPAKAERTSPGSAPGRDEPPPIPAPR
jgi:tetratricopeptide (TPR) repeat protein